MLTLAHNNSFLYESPAPVRRRPISIAIGVSVFLHIILSIFYYENWHDIELYPAKPDEVISFHLSPPPEVTHDVEPVVETDPIIPPLPVIKPEPVKEIEPLIKPEPIIKSEKVDKPKPILKPRLVPRTKPVRVKPVVKKEAVIPEPQPVQAVVFPTPIVKKVVTAVVSQAKAPQQSIDEYMSKLLQHITSFKVYPRKARRKGIEGSVSISFKLLRSGELEALSIDGHSKILRKAARKAILSSLPMPRVPVDVSLPEAIRFNMVYKLTD